MAAGGGCAFCQMFDVNVWVGIASFTVVVAFNVVLAFVGGT